MNRYLLLISAFTAFSCASASRSPDKDFGPQYVKCQKGEIEACYNYAESQVINPDGRTTRAAIVAYQYACFNGHAPACSKIGEVYGSREMGVSKDRQREAFKSACEKNEAEACARYADMLSTQEAIGYYEKSCELNHGPGCSLLAAIFRKNWRFSNGLQKALAFEKKACDLGDDAGCFAVGQAYLFGSGVEKNAEKARPYLERSCNDKNGAGCTALGKIFASGIGVEKNLQRANHYYERAEEHKKVSVRQSPQSAYLIFVDACNYGDILGCYDAGYFLAQGLEVKRNISTAREFFQRACRSGLKNACEKWTSIEQSRDTHTTHERVPVENHVLDKDGHKINK